MGKSDDNHLGLVQVLPPKKLAIIFIFILNFSSDVNFSFNKSESCLIKAKILHLGNHKERYENGLTNDAPMILRWSKKVHACLTQNWRIYKKTPFFCFLKSHISYCGNFFFLSVADISLTFALPPECIIVSPFLLANILKQRNKENIYWI